MAYSKIEGRKLTVTMNMKKSESKSAPYILHGRGRGLSDDWIENADGLRPIPPTAELRELEPFVGRGRHRLLPPGGEKEALIGQLHGRGNVRQQNQIDRTRRRQRRRDDGLHRYLGLLNHSALLLLPTLNIPSIRWRDSRSRTRKLHPIPSLLSHVRVLRTTFFKIKTKNKKKQKGLLVYSFTLVEAENIIQCHFLWILLFWLRGRMMSMSLLAVRGNSGELAHNVRVSRTGTARMIWYVLYFWAPGSLLLWYHTAIYSSYVEWVVYYFNFELLFERMIHFLKSLQKYLS